MVRLTIVSVERTNIFESHGFSRFPKNDNRLNARAFSFGRSTAECETIRHPTENRLREHLRKIRGQRARSACPHWHTRAQISANRSGSTQSDRAERVLARRIPVPLRFQS